MGLFFNKQYWITLSGAKGNQNKFQEIHLRFTTKLIRNGDLKTFMQDNTRYHM